MEEVEVGGIQIRLDGPSEWVIGVWEIIFKLINMCCFKIVSFINYF